MTTTTPTRRVPQAGPPLPPIAIATVALFLVSLVLPTILAGGATYPSPYSSTAVVVGYFQANSGPVLITALLQFAASLPLAIFAATSSVRLNRLGVRAPGATIALVGGILASSSMALSAFLTWTLTRPEILAHGDLIRLAVGGLDRVSARHQRLPAPRRFSGSAAREPTGITAKSERVAGAGIR